MGCGQGKLGQPFGAIFIDFIDGFQPDQVWILRDGRAEAVVVTTGASNGLVTEILSGAIEPGMDVIIDTVAGDR